jgi:hypothetical protein
MADLSGTLTIAVSARALFDLEEDHRYYEDHGLTARFESQGGGRRFRFG